MYYGLDTDILKLMETRKNNSSSLDTQGLIRATEYKWMMNVWVSIKRMEQATDISEPHLPHMDKVDKGVFLAN